MQLNEMRVGLVTVILKVVPKRPASCAFLAQIQCIPIQACLHESISEFRKRHFHRLYE